MLFSLTGLLGFFSLGGGGGGFLSCWLPASSAMSGLTLSLHLGYPSLIPGSGDGVRQAVILYSQSNFSEKKNDHMFFMLTRLFRFFLDGFLSC